MTFPEWVDLAAAFVRVESAAVGWVVRRRVGARTTRSVYLHLKCVTGAEAMVRLSDHKPGKLSKRRASMFSVRQAATAKLSDLRAFLTARAGRVERAS